MKRMLLFGVLGTLIFLFFCPSPVHAATFTFDGVPTSLNESDTITAQIFLSISGSSGNTYYIRGAFAHVDSSTSYFGYTKNNQGTWYTGSDKTQYYQITMNSSNQWTGEVEFKLDPADTAYRGSGNYTFKIGRYSSSSSTSVTWCNTESSPCTLASISVTAPTPTSTPTPTLTLTPTPTNTPSPTPTSAPSATNTPTPSPTPTKTPTPTPSPTPKTTPSPTSSASAALDNLGIQQAGAEEKSPTGGFVLGNFDESTPTPSPSAATDGRVNYIPIGFMALGVVFMAGFGILSYPALRFWEKM